MVTIFLGHKLNPLRKLSTGRLVLYPGRLELELEPINEAKPLSASEGRLRFNLPELEGEVVFRRNILEFYHDRNLFQLHFPTRNSSALKWLLALGLLRTQARDTKSANLSKPYSAHTCDASLKDRFLAKTR